MALTTEGLRDVCSRSNIRAVSIDFSGTLTAPTRPHHPARPWRAYLDDLVDRGRMSSTIAELRLPALLAGEDLSWTACLEYGASYSIQRILREAHVPHVDTAMEAFRSTFVRDMAVTEAARDAVRKFREAGIRVGLLSNSIWPREWFVRTLTEQRIINDFDAVLVSSETPHCKPNPQFFQRLIMELQADATSTVHIGDRAFEDVDGARGAGIRAVHFGASTDESDSNGVRHMVDWKDIENVLEAWSNHE